MVLEEKKVISHIEEGIIEEKYLASVDSIPLPWKPLAKYLQMNSLAILLSSRYLLLLAACSFSCSLKAHTLKQKMGQMTNKYLLLTSSLPLILLDCTATTRLSINQRSFLPACPLSLLRSKPPLTPPITSATQSPYPTRSAAAPCL